MEQNRGKSAQNLGVAALVTGIVTFIIAVIPCIGIVAVIPGIIAIVLAVVGLGRATQEGRGMLIASLIIGIVATLISMTQWAFVGNAVSKMDIWENGLRRAVEEVKTNVIDEIEKGDFSIRIESGDDIVEIRSTIDSKESQDKLDKLEKLEGVSKPDTIKEPEPPGKK
ncbi:MAG: DUF4190 domain-containing protein [Bacteroidetes bacterium]|nr:DUF4190 domain-containing protein [Bacteroidota bacterium]